MIFSSLLSILSHPMRVRGLKLGQMCSSHGVGLSHPMRVRGLKQGETRNQVTLAQSHPMRVRWLKCKLLYSVGEFVLALHSR